MPKNRQYKNWQILLASTGVVSVTLTYSATHACAQNITIDGTLGTAETLTGPNYLIPQSSGQTVGNNLFYSFGKFNLNADEAAIFSSANNIRNILSRVTGGTPSSINGLIRTLGSDVNFFLINPSGIIFGQNAQLDVSGSFVASTANGIQFGDRGFFSATNLEPPSPLLTINPSALFFNQLQAGKIETSSNLQVADGKSLLLVGGDITIDGGRLNAPSGRVELAGIQGAGTVELNVNGSNLSLNVPEDLAKTDVFLINQARVNVVGEGGGSITVNARNLELKQRSVLVAGIKRGLGTSQTQAGDIEINTTDTVLLDGERTAIANQVPSNTLGNTGSIKIATSKLLLTNEAGLDIAIFGTGNAGNVNINASDTVSLDNSTIFTAHSGEGKSGNIEIATDSFSILNGAVLDSGIYGRGDAGNIKINASNTVSFDGSNSNGRPSVAFSGVIPEAQGNGGNIEITTGSLFVTNGAQLDSSTLGQGNAGSVKIDAQNIVSFDGFHNLFLLSPSAIFTSVESGAVGKGGNIEITAASLSMTNGAQLQANTKGEGDAGSVKINARNTVSLDGVSSNGLSSAVFSSIDGEGIGKGGNIDIAAESLFITNGAALVVSNLGKGDAGDVTIHARNIVSLDGVGSNGFPSAVFSSVAEDPSGSVEKPIGNGGDINITTDLLTVTNGARLAASTLFGQGNAGLIKIQAREVAFDGVGSDGPSGAFSAVGSEAVGDGVGIQITTESLAVKNGALLSTSTRGQGNGGDIILYANTLEAVNGGQAIATSFSGGQAGNIILYVTDSITLSGSDPTFFHRLAQFGENVEDAVIGVSPNSGLFANTSETSTSQGGSLNITTGQLIVQNGAEVSVSNKGTGNAGNLEIASFGLFLDNQGKLTAETASGQGGNITLKNLDLLLLRNNSLISTTAGTAEQGGDGGNIDIDAKFIVAVPQENSDITANAFTGKGGRVNITSNSIFGIFPQERPTPQSDITASSELGVNGQITINTLDLDPSRGLVQLPSNLVDASQQIASGCSSRRGKTVSRFTATGRGGLPLSPHEPLRGQAVITDWVNLPTTNSVAQSPPQFVEAQHWIVDPHNNVILVTEPPQMPVSVFCARD